MHEAHPLSCYVPIHFIPLHSLCRSTCVAGVRVCLLCRFDGFYTFAYEMELVAGWALTPPKWHTHQKMCFWTQVVYRVHDSICSIHLFAPPPSWSYRLRTISWCFISNKGTNDIDQHQRSAFTRDVYVSSCIRNQLGFLRYNRIVNTLLMWHARTYLR